MYECEVIGDATDGWGSRPAVYEFGEEEAILKVQRFWRKSGFVELAGAFEAKASALTESGEFREDAVLQILSTLVLWIEGRVFRWIRIEAAAPSSGGKVCPAVELSPFASRIDRMPSEVITRVR
jgi:hypothetical protein